MYCFFYLKIIFYILIMIFLTGVIKQGTGYSTYGNYARDSVVVNQIVIILFQFNVI